ncbi:hypothetical protein HZS_4143, partial [Henneguya salminicola]
MAKRNSQTECDHFISEFSTKRSKLVEPINIGSVSNSDDLDQKVLQIQNENLFRRCQELTSNQAQLQSKIEELTKQKQDQEIIIGILKNGLKEVRNFTYFKHTNDIKYSIDTLKTGNGYAFSISNKIKGILRDSLENAKKIVSAINKPSINGQYENCCKDFSTNTNDDSSLLQLDVSLSPSEYFKFRAFITEFNFLKDSHASLQEEVNQLQNKLDELSCGLTTIEHRYDVLLTRYDELKQKKEITNLIPPPEKKEENIDEELRIDLKSYKDIAAARLAEIDDIQSKYREVLSEFARYKSAHLNDCSQNITNSPEYRSLQHQYESLIADSSLLKQQVDLYRQISDFSFNEQKIILSVIQENVQAFRSHVKEALTRLNKELYHTKVEFYRYQFNYQFNNVINDKNAIDLPILKMLESLERENKRLRENKILDLRKVYNCGEKTESTDAEDLRTTVAMLQSSNIPIIDEIENLTAIYEETFAQNVSFMQQIHETETTHAKSFTENLKLNQLVKSLVDERDNLKKELSMTNSTITNFTQQLPTVETKIAQLSECLATANQESNMRANLLDLHKRKSLEINQKYTESYFHIEQLKSTIEANASQIAENIARIENEAVKNRRCNEEISILKRKLEHAHNNQYGGASDRILLEEVKILKHKLTCSCCNTRQKDAVLTKCYHLFCFECLATTYNTRQRKCPRCSQNSPLKPTTDRIQTTHCIGGLKASRFLG